MVLHEANIQKKSNICILINIVKKDLQTNRKTICILIIWSRILMQSFPTIIIVDHKS